MSAPPPSRPFLLGEVALVLFLLFGYDRVAGSANVQAAAAVRHGSALLSLERSLHLSLEWSLNRLLAGHELLTDIFAIYYDFAHGLVTFGALLALYVWRAAAYRAARRALIGINGIALLIFLMVPVAPPRLLPGAGFVDVVAQSGTWGSWEASASTVAQHADKYAALPSLHMAWALWVLRAALAAGLARWVRGLAVSHVALTALIVVSTANHYLIDVAAGLLLAELAWRASALPWRDLSEAVLRRRPTSFAPAPRSGLRRTAAMDGEAAS